jgi:ribosome biogenesis GTPase / thiamine phosphate phosphatase
MEIEDLGYDNFFEAARKKLGWGGFAVGRVAAEYKEAYRVKDPKGEYLAKVTGKQMFTAVSREDYPAVGDWVAFTDLGEGQAVIEGILPRKTMIKRKSSAKFATQIIATNIDTAFVVQAVDGDYSLNRFERYFAIANDGGVKPAIILNKIDLIPKEELDLKLGQIRERFGDIDLIATSTLTEAGLEELKKYIKKGKTYCFLGSSGVGKSSLINKLIGKEVIETKDISVRTDRGKHTTTGREMYVLESGPLPAESASGEVRGIVIDNPGLREVGMADTGAGIDDLFDQIAVLAKDCKFADCKHGGEPGCRVLGVVKSGELDEGKYNNYIGLKKEAEYYEMNKVEKREKDRQFGKFIKKAKEQLKKYE